jgi:hypothetical protein
VGAAAEGDGAEGDGELEIDEGAGSVPLATPAQEAKPVRLLGVNLYDGEASRWHP